MEYLYRVYNDFFTTDFMAVLQREARLNAEAKRFLDEKLASRRCRRANPCERVRWGRTGKTRENWKRLFGCFPFHREEELEIKFGNLAELLMLDREICIKSDKLSDNKLSNYSVECKAHNPKYKGDYMR